MIDILVEAEHANTVLNSIFLPNVGKYTKIIPSFTASVREASSRIAFWSKITLIPTFVGLGLSFTYYRFLMLETLI